MKRFLLIFVAVTTLMILPFFVETAASQPPPPPPQDIPIDGGLSILLIAGAAYGAKRLYSASKEDEPS